MKGQNIKLVQKTLEKEKGKDISRTHLETPKAVWLWKKKMGVLLWEKKITIWLC